MGLNTQYRADPEHPALLFSGDFAGRGSNEIVEAYYENGQLSIDIPNGGNVLIAGNTLEKGPHSDNHEAAISIGAEEMTNPTGSVIVRDNTFHNDMAVRVLFVRINPWTGGRDERQYDRWRCYIGGESVGGEGAVSRGNPAGAGIDRRGTGVAAPSWCVKALK